MFFFGALIHATALVIAGYFVLHFSSGRAEDRIKTAGKYIAIWCFALGAVIAIGGIAMSAMRMMMPHRPGMMMMHRGMGPGMMGRHFGGGRMGMRPGMGMGGMGGRFFFRRRDGQTPETPADQAKPAAPAATAPAAPAKP